MLQGALDNVSHGEEHDTEEYVMNWELHAAKKVGDTMVAIHSSINAKQKVQAVHRAIEMLPGYAVNVGECLGDDVRTALNAGK